MTKTLEKGAQKIQEICDLLKKETLEPAKQEAVKILLQAQSEAEDIIAKAKQEASALIAAAHRKMEEERNVFQSALAQAAKQSVESLKQSIEEKVFNQQLDQLIAKQTTSPEIIAQIIQSLLKAVEKEGVRADLSAVIPKTVSPEAVNALLGKEILNQLKGKSVEVGYFTGGAQLKLHDKNLTLDMSDSALKELLANFVRKDFRKLFFAS